MLSNDLFSCATGTPRHPWMLATLYLANILASCVIVVLGVRLFVVIRGMRGETAVFNYDLIKDVI